MHLGVHAFIGAAIGLASISISVLGSQAGAAPASEPFYSSFPMVVYGERPPPRLGVGEFEVHWLYSATSPAVIYVNQSAVAACRPADAQVRILTQPAHGKLQVERRTLSDDTVLTGPTGAYSGGHGRCDFHKLQSTWLRFVPAAGFTGTDTASVEIREGPNLWRGKLWLRMKR